jgi:hypothetical protein
MRPARLVHAARALIAASALALTAACSDGDDPVDVIQAPAAPTGLTVSASGTSGARVTWAAVSDADGYVVERATGAAGTFASIATPAAGATSYDDAGLAASTTYRYRVFAVRGTARSAASSEATYAPGTSGPRMRVVTGNITANQSWTADTTYVVSGFVKVVEPARLTIAAGTRIVGDSAVAGSALFILQGAQIDARGTAAQPIVFTSQRAVGVRQPGDWGGLVIVGRGVINRSGRVLVEGTTQSTTSEVNYGGGTSNGDDSGTLQYVRVEFAGYPVLPNAELNSFTFAAVGSGTTVDHLQAMAGLDDSFEWFGGSVDGRYLVSYEAGDDHFDWTEGYNGRNQFMIALQTYKPTPRAGAGFASQDPRGFEGDGCETTKAGCGDFNTKPYSMPVFANFTAIGTGPNVFAGISAANTSGSTIRRGSGGVLINGVIARWQGIGLNVVDAETNQRRLDDSLFVSNNVFASNGGGNFNATGTGFGQLTNFPTNDDSPADPTTFFAGLPAAGATPTLGALDWTPSTGSVLRTGGLTTLPAKVAARVTGYFANSFQATAFRGAADPAGTKWWAGWTSYARN